MKAIEIILIILFVLVLLWPFLSRTIAPLIQRWMFGKMEDHLRRMSGMPTRKEEKKARREAERQARRSDGGHGFGSRRSPRNVKSTISMLKYVAEDVEFTEVKDFGAEEVTTKTTVKVEYKIEQQIQDAEFEEIKDSKD